jgi:uncharacterized protein DUF6600/FecR-like protein
MLGLGVCLALAAGSAWADEAANQLAGRVSAVAGSVQYQSADSPWGDALVNDPAAAGTGLRSTLDAAAELRLPGISVTLAGDSEVRILRLDKDVAQLALTRGRAGFHLEAAAPATVEIDLPHGGVWLSGKGDYDIADEPEGPARIEVLAGAVSLGGGLDEKNMVTPAADEMAAHANHEDDNADRGHLAAGIVGAAALSSGGSWKSDATFGDVWYPNGVAEDWVPYRDGVWRFLPPSGWTWIDNAPWGFITSHYGRWARIDKSWAWVPPPRDKTPEYSPAVVAFLGTAPIGLSCPGNTGPAVAWFPLAPGETVGDGKDASYKNRAFATAIPRGVFAGGRPAATALVDLPTQRFADAPVILGPLGIAPVLQTVVAAAARKPAAAAAAKATVIAAAAKASAAAHAIAKKAAVVTVAHAAPPPAARKPAPPHRLAASAPGRKRVTIATAVRARPAASTNAAHPAHNRQHLAARGGAS